MYGSFDYGILSYPSDITSELILIPAAPETLLTDPGLLRSVIKQINDFQANLLKLLSALNMIHISNRFYRLSENLIPLCGQLIVTTYIYLGVIGANIVKYVLDVYDLGEEGYSEIKPFIEIYVDVKEVDKMLDIWGKTISFLRAMLGDEVLNLIDIFFTRA